MISFRTQPLPAIICSIVLGLLAGHDSVFAQTPADSTHWWLDAYVGYGFGALVGSFGVAQGGAITSGGACGAFENGSSSEVVLGLGAERTIGGARILLLGDARWMRGDMRYPCVDPAETRMPDGTLADASTEFVAHVALSSATLRLLYGVRPFDVPVTLAAGPYTTLRYGATYDSHEEIAAPRAAYFESTGTQLRSIGSGSFDGPTFAGGIAASLRFEATAGPRLSLVPELDLRYGILDEVPQASLARHSVIMSLGLQLAVPATAEPVEAPPPGPTLALSLRSLGAAPDVIQVEERRTIATRLQPLLPYLFFDSASATLPPRYVQRRSDEVAGFDESELADSSVLGLYYNVLDIVGSRLRQHPDARITVSAAAPESGGGELAARRANGVVEYLKNVWGIEAHRIDVTTRAQPVNPSSESTAEGAAENRRVELASDMYDITAPILLADTTTRVDVPEIEVDAESTGDIGGATWRLMVDAPGAADSTTALFVATGGPPVPAHLRVELNHSAHRLLQSVTSLHSTIRLERGGVGLASASATIPVRVRSIAAVEHVTGYYSLILFDFGSSNLRPEHRRTIDLVNQRISGTPRVVVRGYTDRIGEDSLNAALSRDRAARVAVELRAAVESVEGLGESDPLYDNRLPEGRFYSRCVTIETTSGASDVR